MRTITVTAADDQRSVDVPITEISYIRDRPGTAGCSIRLRCGEHLAVEETRQQVAQAAAAAAAEERAEFSAPLGSPGDWGLTPDAVTKAVEEGQKNLATAKAAKGGDAKPDSARRLNKQK